MKQRVKRLERRADRRSHPCPCMAVPFIESGDPIPERPDPCPDCGRRPSRQTVAFVEVVRAAPDESG